MPDNAYRQKSIDTETAALKLPPHSIEAEQSILGGVLINKDSWEDIADRVIEDDFYRQDHRLIFRAIVALAEQSDPYDIVTVSEWLDSHKQLEDVGGVIYIANLAEQTAGVSNIKAYADIVKKRSILRQLIQATNTISDSIFNPQDKTTEQILGDAEQIVFDIAERESKGRKNYNSIRELATTALDRIDELSRNKSAITGIATGFSGIDEKTAGLQNSDLIIIAGRPSMGKTALALNIAEQAALKGKLTVAIFSMEMPGSALTMRIFSSLARINQHNIRTGRLQDNDWPRLTSAFEILKDVRLFIDDTSALTPTEIRARCRRIHREQDGLDLVIVDYLQLMQGVGNAENRVAEISYISRSLKSLARELNIPIIALSQLNRSLEQRPNKRPVMSDLRDSGAIEQDADVIIFIYRDEIYNEDTAEKGKAEILIAKQRNGPIGMVPLTFRNQYTRFENYTPDESVLAVPPHRLHNKGYE